jgi:hypothetical protein
MQTTQAPPALVIAYFSLVVVWFVLLKLLFNRLERDHSAKYEAMGRPSLFLRNNIANGFATMKFLFLREHRTLGDTRLSRLADGMLIFLVLFLVAILGAGVLISRLAA